LQALGVLAASEASGGGLGSIIGNVASGGTGGAILLVIVSLFKSALSKSA
jgi:hypothetical protein